MGFEVLLSENYGCHIGINDDEYLKLGVKISKDDNEILSSSDIIVQLGMLSDEKSSIIKESQIRGLTKKVEEIKKKRDEEGASFYKDRKTLSRDARY